MKVELDKQDIELILTEHIQKMFGGKWRCDMHLGYSSQSATFEKINPDAICKARPELPFDAPPTF